jgi:hypothetical protein
VKNDRSVQIKCRGRQGSRFPTAFNNSSAVKLSDIPGVLFSRRREAVHLGRDHHQRLTRLYEAGAKARSPGASVRLFQLDAGVERRRLKLSEPRFYSSLFRGSLFRALYALPDRGDGGGGGNGHMQLPKSGSRPGLHPAPPCRTKRVPSSPSKSFGSAPARCWHHPRRRRSLTTREPYAQTSYAVSMPYLRGRRYESRCSLSMAFNIV